MQQELYDEDDAAAALEASASAEESEGAAAAYDVADGAVGAGGAGEARFLLPHERSQQAALVSYPRSGNSLLRALLESCSGVITGARRRSLRAATHTSDPALSRFHWTPPFPTSVE